MIWTGLPTEFPLKETFSILQCELFFQFVSSFGLNNLLCSKFPSKEQTLNYVWVKEINTQRNGCYITGRVNS